MKILTRCAVGMALAVAAFGGAAHAELRVGDMVPDFELPGSDGKTYGSADFRGKKAFVIAWFPKAFTGG